MALLTTHAGSLPRPPELDQLYARASRGEPVDESHLGALVEAATREVMAAQAGAGIDVAGNGEAPRESFFTYVRQRLSGFGVVGPGSGGTSERSRRRVMADMSAFPSFVELKRRTYGVESVSVLRPPACVGPVAHVDPGPLQAELDGLERGAAAVAADQGQSPFAELFCTAASPGIVAAAMENRHYARDTDYLEAVARALAPEYRAILDAGLVLQIDAPDLAMERHTSFADRPLDEFVDFAERVVAGIAEALGPLSPEERRRVRLHVCWGNYDGPHHLDVPLEAILPVLASAPVGALSLPFANPRHAHEHRLLADGGLPPDMDLVAGVIDTTSNYVEHPAVVADRLEAVVGSVGDPARVMAGTDCGFATAAGFSDVAREVVWLKLRALVDGARLASERLGLA